MSTPLIHEELPPIKSLICKGVRPLVRHVAALVPVIASNVQVRGRFHSF